MIENNGTGQPGPRSRLEAYIGTIQTMLDNGRTYSQIVQFLAGNNVQISRSTLSEFVSKRLRHDQSEAPETVQPPSPAQEEGPADTVPLIAELREINETMAKYTTTLRLITVQLSPALAEAQRAQTRIEQGLAKMRSQISVATDQTQAQTQALAHQLRRMIPILCSAAMLLGFLAGTLFEHRRYTPPALQESAAAAIQTAPPAPTTSPQKQKRVRK